MSKNNKKWYEEKSGVKKLKYGIRKVSFGAASVVIGATVFLPGGVASAESIINVNKETEVSGSIDPNVINSSNLLEEKTTENTTSSDNATTEESTTSTDNTTSTVENVGRRVKRDVSVSEDSVSVTIPYTNPDEARKAFNNKSDDRISKSIIVYDGDEVNIPITANSNEQIKEFRVLATSSYKPLTSVFGLTVSQIIDVPTNSPATITISGMVQAPANYNGQLSFGYSNVVQAKNTSENTNGGYENIGSNNKDFIWIALGRLTDKINVGEIVPVPVNNENSLTEDEKNAVKENVTAALKSAGMKDNQLGNINVADDGNVTVTYSDRTTKSIAKDQTIRLLQEIKNEAKQEVDQKATEKKSEIDNRNNLSQDKKNEAKQEVDQKATESKNAIDQATTEDTVNQAKDNGITEITNINPQADPVNPEESTVTVAIPYTNVEEARKAFNNKNDDRISKAIIIYDGEDVNIPITATSNKQIKEFHLLQQSSYQPLTDVFGLKVSKITDTPTNSPATITISGKVKAPANY